MLIHVRELSKGLSLRGFIKRYSCQIFIMVEMIVNGRFLSLITRAKKRLEMVLVKNISPFIFKSQLFQFC